MMQVVWLTKNYNVKASSPIFASKIWSKVGLEPIRFIDSFESCLNEVDIIRLLETILSFLWYNFSCVSPHILCCRVIWNHTVFFWSTILGCHRLPTYCQKCLICIFLWILVYACPIQKLWAFDVESKQNMIDLMFNWKQKLLNLCVE